MTDWHSMEHADSAGPTDWRQRERPSADVALRNLLALTDFDAAGFDVPRDFLRSVIEAYARWANGETLDDWLESYMDNAMDFLEGREPIWR